MNLKISPREQLMLIAASAFLLLVLFGFFVVYPNVSKIIQLNGEQDNVSRELSSAEATLTRLKALKRDASKLEADLAKLKIRLPDESEIPTLIIDVNKIAKDAGIEFIQVAQSEWVGGEGYTEIPLNITMEGRYFDIIDFLYRLRHHAREIVVMSINIAEGPDGLPQVSATIDAKTFTLKAPLKEGAEQTQPGAGGV
ncbi:MAG: type 4a pilus biogenesis protein PilO [Actinomycetota bacterium]|nr:type 4a pilus biogenesis protein PilO [Actinomycetota bacterium]